MPRIRVLTDEEWEEKARRDAKMFKDRLDAAAQVPHTWEEFKENVSRQTLQPSPPMLLTVEDVIALRFTAPNDTDRLEVVNQARKQWGFPPVAELLGYHED